MGLFFTAEGRATRRFPRPVQDVWRALVADPTPEEMQRWSVEHYVRRSPTHAEYRQRGRLVEARVEILEEGRWLRSTNRADGAHPEMHEFLITPVDAHRTRVALHTRLAFRVPRRAMRERLDAMLDGITLRLADAQGVEP